MYGFLKESTRRVRKPRRSELEEIAARPAQSCGLSKTRRVYNEFAGTIGKDATRYGDWEYAGRCTDF